jgi:Cu-processing system permease protein
VNAVLAIAVLTMRELVHRKLAWVMLVMGALFLGVFGLGIWFINRELDSGMVGLVTRTPILAMLTTAGLYVGQFLVLALAVVASVDTLPGEIASGTIQTVASKPVRRSAIVLGKFLGHAVVVALFAAAIASGVVGLVGAVADYRPPQFLLPLGLIVLEGWVVLGLTYALGAITGTLASGLGVFMLYALALVGSWIERIGSLAGNTSAQYLGIAASLAMPTEAVWQRAASELLPPLVRSTIGLISPFTSANPPSDWMLVYAVLYAAVCLLVAVKVFERRDL